MANGEPPSEAAREAELARREAALRARVELADDILATARVRDDEADQRDDDALERDQFADLAAFVTPDGESHTHDAGARRDAAKDRKHSKDDRRSAASDRQALTEDADPEE